MGTNPWKKVKILQTSENTKSQFKEGRRQAESSKFRRPQSEGEETLATQEDACRTTAMLTWQHHF